MTDKETFWALKRKAADVGISAGLMGKLASTCGNYVVATELLNIALGMREPLRWLGATIRNLIQSPQVIRQARLHNIPVLPYNLSDGSQGWRVGSTVYNKDGVDVGG